MDPYNIREIFQAMEYDLIKSLKKSFEKHAMDEINEGFKWDMWQLAKLREMENFRKRNREIIGQYSPEVERIIQETLTEYYVKGEKKVVSDVKKMDELTLALLFPRGIDTEDSFSPENIFFGMNDKKLEALIKTVKDDIKNPQHAVLRKMDDVYRQTIYRAEMSMATGTKTLGQAIDMATEDFRKQGLNVVQYSNGSMHNLATYAEMSLRTASQRATFMGEGKKRDQFGIHLVVVSAHANTCDLCLPWQGKVLIDDVYSSGSRADGEYHLLSMAFEAGFGHPNCRHSITTFYPGVSRIPEVPPDDAVRANYKAEQRQRTIEREIRKNKRLEAGCLDLESQNNYAKKVREWQGKMREHLETNAQLRREYRRERPGTGISNKELKAHKEKLVKDSYKDMEGIITPNGMIINSTSDHFIERSIERKISAKEVKDALTKPLNVGKIKHDKDNKPSIEYLGEFVRVQVNPEDGKLVTSWKTSKKLRKKYMGDNNGKD